MTKATYNKFNDIEYKGKHAGRIKIGNIPYTPKHAAKLYYVYRVLSAIGPEENLTVYGLDRVKELITGCWDYDVLTSDGKVVFI